MNQDTTTPPQNHPWVTASTPNNLRDPQLLQDLSEIGMTCLLGWHALMDTPHSYAAESVWYGKAKHGRRNWNACISPIRKETTG